MDCFKMWNIGLSSQSEYAVPMLFNDFNIKVQFFVHKFAIIAWKYKMWCKSLLGSNLPRSWHTRPPHAARILTVGNRNLSNENNIPQPKF